MQEDLSSSPLNCLKEVRPRAWPRQRAIARENYSVWARGGGRGVGGCGELAGPVCSDFSLSPIVSAAQGEHLLTKQLLFPSSCEFHPFCLKPQTLLLSSGWHIRLNGLSLSLSCLCGTSICTKLNLFSPVNLSYIDLIIRSAKERRREGGKS